MRYSWTAGDFPDVDAASSSSEDEILLRLFFFGWAVTSSPASSSLESRVTHSTLKYDFLLL